MMNTVNAMNMVAQANTTIPETSTAAVVAVVVGLVAFAVVGFGFTLWMIKRNDR